MNLAELRIRGFDESLHVAFTHMFTVRCSSCSALVINGIPAHETGCPNATRECSGCNARIPARHKYCGDCV